MAEEPDTSVEAPETVATDAPAAPKPLKERAPGERRKARRILNSGKSGPPSIYDPAIHPAGIIAYFKAKLEEIKAPERIEEFHGRVTWVQKPVPPPTLSGYAVEIGVSRQTLWEWRKEHDEFAEAADLCHSIQEQVLLGMGATGGYQPQVVNFMLKNLQGWSEKVDQNIQGSVILNFDAQDEDL